MQNLSSTACTNLKMKSIIQLHSWGSMFHPFSCSFVDLLVGTNMFQDPNLSPLLILSRLNIHFHPKKVLLDAQLRNFTNYFCLLTTEFPLRSLMLLIFVSFNLLIIYEKHILQKTHKLK